MMWIVALVLVACGLFSFYKAHASYNETKITIFGVVGCALMISGVAMFSFEFSRHICSSKAAKMGRISDHGFVTGCMVEVDGSWHPIKSLIVHL